MPSSYRTRRPTGRSTYTLLHPAPPLPGPPPPFLDACDCTLHCSCYCVYTHVRTTALAGSITYRYRAGAYTAHRRHYMPAFWTPCKHAYTLPSTLPLPAAFCLTVRDALPLHIHHDITCHDNLLQLLPFTGKPPRPDTGVYCLLPTVASIYLTRRYGYHLMYTILKTPGGKLPTLAIPYAELPAATCLHACSNFAMAL